MTKVALITGAAKRIGAVIAKTLHEEGMNVVLHYHHSEMEATTLCNELNAIRDNSATLIQGDISNSSLCENLIFKAQAHWGQIDILINNASSFYATPLGKVQDTDWEDLLGSNLKGPFFLCQATAPYLQTTRGSIVNIVDIHADKPLKNYPVYSIAKAGLVMLTKSLARELAPKVRVNAVAPGLILWPNDENTLSTELQNHLISRTCLKRKGTPNDIAETVLFLLNQGYITGQVIAVDGGRSIRD